MKKFEQIADFKRAILYNNVILLQKLLNEGLSASIENNYGINYAILHGNVEVVKVLLEHDIEIRDFALSSLLKRDSTSLVDDGRVNIKIGTKASRKNQLEILKLIIKDGRTNLFYNQSSDYEFNWFYHEAIKVGDKEIANIIQMYDSEK